jgi:hypothetical protein
MDKAAYYIANKINMGGYILRMDAIDYISWPNDVCGSWP